MKDQSKFAKKHLGQNFLTNLEVRNKILTQAGDLKGKKVLEIGPGLGFLTEALVDSGAEVTAIELDERAFNFLSKKFTQKKNLTLLNQDILQTNLEALIGHDDYSVIANIPYNITNPIIRKLLEKTQNKPDFALLMVQKEVAQKICDPVSDQRPKRKPNSDHSLEPFGVPLRGVAESTVSKKKNKRSILSIAVEVYAVAEYCFTVPRDYFEPVPKVDSAIMKLTTRAEPLIDDETNRAFFTVVNAGFSEKRKKIGNVLGKFFGLPSNQLLGEIDGNRRAETLSIEEWKTITENFQSLNA